MSLTRHLDNPASAVRRYLEDRFAIVEQSKRGNRWSSQATAILGFNDLPREPVLKLLAPPAYAGVIGCALDYRIRYYFGVYDTAKTAAARGAAMLRRIHADPVTREPLSADFEVPPSGELAGEFFRLHERTIAKLKPVKRRLAEEDEDAIARHCLILSYYEAIFRAGRLIDSPLYRLSSRASIRDLLALALPECVADVRQLSFAFHEDAQALFQLPAILNPSFVGSIMIGGADADLVLGDTLIDIKTAVDVRKRFRDALYQLLGYAMLDYCDDHGIKSIGIYFARHRKQWVAPLWHFLFPVASVTNLVANQQEPSETEIATALDAVRREFKVVVSNGISF